MSEAHARTDENGETDDAPALVGIERRVRVPPRPRGTLDRLGRRRACKGQAGF